ncbi:MAG: DUF4372 domain-containing protein [Paludibacter sp.]|nr:DUF4372 domain-containing protein [Paludibacter sp.]
MSLVNEYEFKKCVDHYKGDKHSIKFKCRDQFMVMSFARGPLSIMVEVRSKCIR